MRNRQIYDLYITGSNAQLLSSELATLLTGRHILFTVHPTFKREVGNLLAIKDNFPKLSITNEKFLPGLTETGIKPLSLLEFLQTKSYKELFIIKSCGK